MSDAVVVVEAAPTGGAQITARLANDYDREVFALPGQADAFTSAGCNNLIKQNQAHLITSGEDIAYLLQWSDDKPVKPVRLPENLTMAEKRLLAVLRDFQDGLELDRLTWAANLTVSESAIALVNLECQSLVKCLPGNRYMLR